MQRAEPTAGEGFGPASRIVRGAGAPPAPDASPPPRWTAGARGHGRRVAVLLVVATAACGGGGEGGEATGTSAALGATTTSTLAEATTTTDHVEEDGGGALSDEVPDDLAHTDEGHTQLVELALELLIGADELAGQSFTDAGFLPSEGPGPCGVDADAEEPPDVLVGTSLRDADGRSIIEELRVYPDTDASAAAYAAHRDSLDCGTDGAGTTFGTATDVADQVGAGAASEVAVVSEDESGVTITALVADAVLTFRITAPAATPPGPDPREVAAFGVGKVLAALEASAPDVGD